MAVVLGQVVAGSYNQLVVRQKRGISLEMGGLAIAEAAGGKLLLQVYDLSYGSQLSPQTREFISGLKLEEDNNLELLDAELRNYTLAFLRPLVLISGGKASACKALPGFFSQVRAVAEEDLSFLSSPPNPLFIGHLRSGSRRLAHEVFLDGALAFSHHILIPAQTGKGKSNLASCMLWSAAGSECCGVLVLDPHDEYYGRNRPGLKDHPDARQRVLYYTPNSPPPGARALKISIRALRPAHLRGVMFWSDAQWEALHALYRRYRGKWVEECLRMEEVPQYFQEGTIAVLKRRLLSLLSLEVESGEIYMRGIFDAEAGQSTIHDICDALERGSTVIVDTSSFDGAAELLIGSMLASEIFRRYKSYKLAGELERKPVVSILLEEAPRVIGKEALEKGSNIFSTIAREGRKFKVGLTAITQLPSLIPRDILANMSTKIILGIEMAPERRAIIDAAAQDLSMDERAIAALDKGEAIITSHFTKFAIPVAIPLFEDLVNAAKKYVAVQRAYPGLKP